MSEHIDFTLWSDAQLAVGARHADRSEHGAELLAEIARRARCELCGHEGGHSRECINATREEFPAIGDVSEGHGEYAGGDVQAVHFTKKRRKTTRHDQLTPLPGDPGWEDYRRTHRG